MQARPAFDHCSVRAVMVTLVPRFATPCTPMIDHHNPAGFGRGRQRHDKSRCHIMADAFESEVGGEIAVEELNDRLFVAVNGDGHNGPNANAVDALLRAGADAQAVAKVRLSWSPSAAVPRRRVSQDSLAFAIAFVVHCAGWRHRASQGRKGGISKSSGPGARCRCQSACCRQSTFGAFVHHTCCTHACHEAAFAQQRTPPPAYT